MMGLRGVNAAVALGVLLRVGVACWNGLAGPSLGASADARNFHQFAVAVSEGRWAPGADLTAFSYAYALGRAYSVTGPSLLIGSLISCLAWLASALLLRRCLKLLNAGAREQFAAMLVFALLPSSVLWTSVTLREPYQLLSVNLTLYAALRILVRPSAASWGLLLLSVVVGALLHGALLAAGVVVAGGLCLRQLWRAAPSPLVGAAVVTGVVVVIAVAGAVAFQRMYSRYDFSGGPAATMERHLASGMRQPSRTVYIDDPSVNGLGEFVIAVPVAVWRYLFEPMPWKMNRPIDVGFLGENALRAFLIGLAMSGAWRLHGTERQHVVLLLAWYLLFETVWAVGTFNWGTAARHHLPASGLLLAAAVAYSSAGAPSLRWPWTRS